MAHTLFDLLTSDPFGVALLIAYIALGVVLGLALHDLLNVLFKQTSKRK